MAIRSQSGQTRVTSVKDFIFPLKEQGKGVSSGNTKFAMPKIGKDAVIPTGSRNRCAEINRNYF